ncbi:hypothetical protein LIER_43612 [Lithospermum erythrorhizon]|uniref:Uncharacterized protein n=1 Tax=Lithospermum erythrorhizon TaxID=34254 RepID=A0AAV3QK49_LITER
MISRFSFRNGIDFSILASCGRGGRGYILALSFQVPRKRRRASKTHLPLVALTELEGVVIALSYFPVTRKRRTVSTFEFKRLLPLLTLAGVGVGVIIASFPVLRKWVSSWAISVVLITSELALIADECTTNDKLRINY